MPYHVLYARSVTLYIDPASISFPCCANPRPTPPYTLSTHSTALRPVSCAPRPSCCLRRLQCSVHVCSHCWRALACCPSLIVCPHRRGRSHAAHSHVIGTGRRHDCVAPPAHAAHAHAVSAGNWLVTQNKSAKFLKTRIFRRARPNFGTYLHLENPTPILKQILQNSCQGRPTAYSQGFDFGGLLF